MTPAIDSTENSKQNQTLRKSHFYFRLKWILAGFILLVVGLALPSIASYCLGDSYTTGRGEIDIPSAPSRQKNLSFKKRESSEIKVDSLRTSELPEKSLAQQVNPSNSGSSRQMAIENPALNLLAFRFASDKTARATATPTPKPSVTPKVTQTPIPTKEKRNFLEKIGDFFVGLCKKVRLCKKKKKPVLNSPANVNSITFDKEFLTLPCPPRTSPTAGSCPDETVVQVTTSATDPDDDPLTYTYTVSGGRIVGRGANVVWDLTGERPGSYTITAGVDDGQSCPECGRTVSKTIEVRECSCRGNTNVTCPKVEVVKSSGDSIESGKPVTFTANVFNSKEPITYSWSVSNGIIIGESDAPFIQVETTGIANGTTIAATVVIGGVNPAYCHKTTDSEFVKISQRASPIGTGNIRIRVVDATGGAIVGAKISLYKDGFPVDRGETDEDGVYSRSNLEEGQYRIVIEFAGALEVRDVVVSTGETEEISVRMEINALDISPTVTPTPITNTNANTSANSNANVSNSSTNTNTAQDKRSDKVTYEYPVRFVEKDKIYTVKLNLQPAPIGAQPSHTTFNTNTGLSNQVTDILPNIPVKDKFDTYVSASLKITSVGLVIRKQPEQSRQKYNLKSGEKGNLDWNWELSLTDEGEKLEKVEYTLLLEVELESKTTGEVVKRLAGFPKEYNLISGVGLPPWVSLAQWLLYFGSGFTFIFGFVGASLSLPGDISQVPPIVEAPTEIASDEVQCTLYSPGEVKAGNELVIQVFAHLLEQSAGIGEIAKSLDEEARERVAQILERKIPRGTQLTFKLIMPGLEVKNPEQSCNWKGKPIWIRFYVSIPENHIGGKRYGEVIVYESNEKIGTIPFSINILARKGWLASLIEAVSPVIVGFRPRPKIQQARMTDYETAFISYASADKERVYEYLTLLDALKVKYSIDILDLDPGDRWEQKLYEFINENDVFFLFWSNAAKQSEWVIKEAEYAHQRTGEDRKNPPRIIIFHLSDPRAEVPDWLKDIHVDRNWAEHIRNARREKQEARRKEQNGG